jgi:hypothetical protein
VHLRLGGRQFSQDSTEAKRVFTKGGPHPVIARGGRVAFVENEVDDFEHRREAGFEFRSTRNLKGNARFREGPFGANNALCHRWLRDKECARDLVGRQTSEQPESEGHAGLAG